MTKQKQIIIILCLAVLLGLLRSFFLNDQEFTLIKKNLTSPMLPNISIDSRDKQPGDIAQLGERLNGIQEVSGSIPLISTNGSEFP